MTGLSSIFPATVSLAPHGCGTTGLRAAGVAALQASTAEPVRRPSEVIAEARGEAPGERKRRKSQVTQEWLEQSQSAVSPGAITHSALSPRRSSEAGAEAAAAAPAQDAGEAAQEQVRDAAVP